MDMTLIEDLFALNTVEFCTQHPVKREDIALVLEAERKYLGTQGNSEEHVEETNLAFRILACLAARDILSDPDGLNAADAYGEQQHYAPRCRPGRGKSGCRS